MDSKQKKEMEIGERIFMLKLSMNLLEGGRMQRFHKEAKELIRKQIEQLKQQDLQS